LAAYTGLYSTYAGAKAPVEHFTRAASKEFGARGISVTAVAPGPMDTPSSTGRKQMMP
jgi:NAD(P)-dependent dehydrogenase (short-subunit alcohol dehydrogenase family)